MTPIKAGAPVARQSLGALDLARIKVSGTAAIVHHIVFVHTAVRSATVKSPNLFPHTHPTHSWLHC